MNESEFLEEFISAVDPADPSPIGIDTVLKAIPEWDSLAILGVIVMFETSFDKKITGEVLAETVTVRDVFNLI
jgi:acyl carrier protein